MTGQHLGHTTVRANASLRTGGRVSLRAEDFTIAQLLKGPEWRDAYDENRAYATAIFGKWGLGEPGTTGLPNDHGFDEWFGFLNQQHAHHHYPEYLWRNKNKETIYGNLGGRNREYASDLMAREALYFIERNRYRPFFLYFTPTVPHAKFEAPELGPYAKEPWPEDAKNYAAMVTRMDGYVGRIMNLLKETGLDQNTLVFFTSDNGGPFEAGPIRSMGALRERKGSIYEGGIRVPMIARWAGRIRSGAVSDHPWAFCDVLPTLGDLAGIRGLPRNLDGISVAPTLMGDRATSKTPTGRYIGSLSKAAAFIKRSVWVNGKASATGCKRRSSFMSWRMTPGRRRMWPAAIAMSLPGWKHSCNAAVPSRRNTPQSAASATRAVLKQRGPVGPGLVMF
jgi:arylsulfatase A-like enzyme